MYKSFNIFWWLETIYKKSLTEYKSISFQSFSKMKKDKLQDQFKKDENFGIMLFMSKQL